MITRTFPGVGSVKGTVKFSEGDRPEKPKGDVVTYKPLKKTDDTEKEKPEKSEPEKE